MKNVFDLAEQCLIDPDLEAKLALTEEAKARSQAGTLDFGDLGVPLPIRRVNFPKQLSFVEPRRLARRSLHTLEGRIALLHAVAHIEFSAVLLHWDGLYRFRGMPLPYYRDWLRVTLEELEHFNLVRGRLNELGAEYGDLPVHAGLWQVAEETAVDVCQRMAMVPRCMEARGLDVTPGMIGGLKQAQDPKSTAILKRILADEIGHVALGSKWFKAICLRQGLEPETTYFESLATHSRASPRGPFNRSLRLQAGFSATELERLEQSAQRNRAT